MVRSTELTSTHPVCKHMSTDHNQHSNILCKDIYLHGKQHLHRLNLQEINMFLCSNSVACKLMQNVYTVQ